MPTFGGTLGHARTVPGGVERMGFRNSKAGTVVLGAPAGPASIGNRVSARTSYKA
jgi:hypothetical protein